MANNQALKVQSDAVSSSAALTPANSDAALVKAVGSSPDAARPAGLRKSAVQQGLLVTLEAKPGRQDQLAAFLNNALAIAAREPGTITWYAYRITETRFGIFDSFATEAGREAHLSGEIARLLGESAEELLAEAPKIQPLSIVASKLR